MISIQTNVDSLNAQQNLNINHAFQSKTIQQLTSGYRINSSADDAAGLAIANSYRSKVDELNQGVSNANDGVSQLQIVDGGLSNISTILDRMKTLATESASQTFTGNRSVLNQEYTGLLSEINRQATNINLNAGGAFNTNLSVYIGGANDVANSTVNVDLSGSTNAVDSTSLGLSSTSVIGGGASIAGNTQNLNTSGATFVKSTGAGASDNQVFTFNLVDSTGAAKQVQATIQATTDGSTLNQVLTSLNSQLSTYGISAGVDSNGALQFSGSSAFTVSDNAAQAPSTIAGLGVPPAVSAKSTGTNLLTNEVPASTTDTTTGTAENTQNFLFDGAATYKTPLSGSTETISFTNTAGETFTAKLDSSSTGATAGDTLAHALASINAQTSSYGVYAVANATGTGISFQSANAFTIKDSTISTTAFAANDHTASGTPLTGLTNFTNNTSTLAANGSAAATPNTSIFAADGVDLSAGTGFLTGTSDKQTFTFKINGVASGSAIAVDITHADIAAATDQPSLLAAIQTKIDTVLHSADPTNYTAGDVKVSLDSSGFLNFSSSASAAHPNALFSVSVAHSAGTNPLVANSATDTGTNAAAQLLNFTYTSNASAATTITVGGLSLNIAKGANKATAMASINSQLAAAGVNTVFASDDGTANGINFQGINKFNVGGSTLGTATNTPSNAYLDSTANAGDKQSFTFNVAGQPGPITLTLAGTAGGYTAAGAVTALNTLLATPTFTALKLAGITAVADANGALQFKSATTSFTVTDNHDSAGDGLTSYASGNTSFTGVNTYDATSTLSTYDQAYGAPTAATTLTVGKTNVSLAAADTVDAAVAKINSALQAAGNSTIVAAVDKAGTGILYEQNGTGNITLGGSSAGTVFANSTATPATFTGNLGAGDGIGSVANANTAINAINAAIGALGLVQGSIGAGENKLQYAINLAQSQISNFSSAESQIRDTDVAQQAANLTKSQVLTQTSIAAMAQANSEPQSVLKLLQ